MSLRHVRRGGRYHRVADPAWSNPLDGSFARSRGGRWNPPGSFPVVYLNASLEVARANLWRRFRGLPYGPQDLAPEAAPLLVTTEVAKDRYADAVTDEGCRAAGLPASYPWTEDGKPVEWPPCHEIGTRAWAEGEPGIACRSAATVPADERSGQPERSPGEELAWFQRDGKLALSGVQPFEDWFWPA